MDVNLASGVDLHIIPTKQFKLNHVLINFTTPQTATNATARNLLANLLETSTHRYPTQTALARQLAKLYGAYVGMGVSRIGQWHTVQLKASFVNDRFAGTDLFKQVMSLVNEILFHPLIDDNEFDGPTFRIQSNNLKRSILALYDDKQFYAQRQLLELYYAPQSVMRVPLFGRVDDLKTLTAQNLVPVYQQLIDQNKVDIFVLGDVDQQEVQSLMAALPFKPRHPQLNRPFYQQPLVSPAKRRVERQQLSQTKLNLAYRLPIYYRDPNYYAGMVFNGLFGGSPYSKLFTNVREKASLAYYATSRLLAFSGVVSVQTGIKAADTQRVEELIGQQLADLQTGAVTPQQLTEVQDGLINQYLSGHDLASNILNQELLRALLQLPANEDVVSGIKRVTVADVEQIAQMMKMQAIYLLSGEKETNG